MTKRDIAIIGAAVRAIRRRATVLGKCGRTKLQEQHTRWADRISELVRVTSKTKIVTSK
jgi:hypothetical protein